MKKVKIGEALSAGWALFYKRPGYLFWVALVMWLLVFATASTNSFATALSYIVFAGYLTLLFKHYNKEHVVFDDLFTHMDQRWISLTFVGLIKGFIIILGTICFIVPGIYFAIKFMFAELYVIDKGMRPIEALRASSQLTKGCRWQLFFFTIVVIFFMILGLLCLVVGIVPAMLITTLAHIHIYKSLQEQGMQNPLS